MNSVMQDSQVNIAAAPLVSIVITTKNEQRNIEACLRSIVGQTYKNFEIIVVDNFSKDKTQEIAGRYTSKVFNKSPERSAQRNYGMRDIACGRYVMYLDADMILAPDLIEQCVQHMGESNCVALHVPEIVLGRGYWSCVRRFERRFYDGTPIDGARFFDRDQFCSVRGFDEQLFVSGSGEDWDIDKKLKQVGRVELLRTRTEKTDIDNWSLASMIRDNGVDPSCYSAVIFHNESEFKLWPYLRKKYYYTKGFDGYIRKWGKNDVDIKKQFSFTYRYIGVFVENGKWVRLISQPSLAAGMYLLRVLVGVCYVFRKLFGSR